MSKKSTTEDFIRKSIEKHGNKYDYSKVEYIKNNTKVCIICKEHGEFFQRPDKHLIGQGCPYCCKTLKKTIDTFIEQANKIHNNKYEYSKSKYVNNTTPLTITCPKHGDFMQTPHNHLKGQGCPKCSKELKHPTKKSLDDFLKTAEMEIYEHISTLIGKENVIQSAKNIIPPKEIDIFIPSLNIGIEYNGLYWHKESKRKDKSYHYDKMMACREKGVKLIQIFEDEYHENKQLVLTKIAHIIKKSNNLPKIMARKCIVKEINNIEAKEFLTLNHIQGFVNSSIYLGAIHNNKLIAVMSFIKEKDGFWNLSRFASDNNFICIGIGGKLFSFFKKKYDPIEVKSFADRRWTINEENNLYLKIGFKFDKYTKIDYRYINKKEPLKRMHKFGFRKEKLHRKYGLPLTMTEKQMTSKLGYDKIYDCGLIKYIWHK